MLSIVEETRLNLSKETDPKHKTLYGQYFTSENTAKFMASLFSEISNSCRLLDAGAGVGSLSVAFIERWINGELNFDEVKVDAFEVDKRLHGYLSTSLGQYESSKDFSVNIWGNDFIDSAVSALSKNTASSSLPIYTHAILNPPYKKIKNTSTHRNLLRQVGIETVNLYSAFVALALALLESKGELVAIIPRSFCNGPYYYPFRRYLLDNSSIRHIHLFKARDKAFKDDEVLQENVIILLERNGFQDNVKVSTSTDNTFADMQTYTYPFSKIVFPDDAASFIHIPLSPEKSVIEKTPTIRYTLSDLDIKVSTGPVVDFRVKNHLHLLPTHNTVPLLYPVHFTSNGLSWPLEGMKKSNAIEICSETEKWLYPIGFYCVVRRFSSKEEKRRIVANVVDPSTFANVSRLGFENHLNVFHQNKQGLQPALAYGLTAFLNTVAVDTYFRRFSGHTQVNASDLKQLKYPSSKVLIQVGKLIMNNKLPDKELIEKNLGL